MSHTYPLSQAYILSDTLLTNLGIILTGTPQQRNTTMILAEAAAGQFLSVVMANTKDISAPPLVDSFKTDVPLDEYSTIWGPVTELISIETSQDGVLFTPISLLLYNLIDDKIVFTIQQPPGYYRITYHAGLDAIQRTDNFLVMGLVLLYKLYLSDLFVPSGQQGAKEGVVEYSDPTHSVNYRTAVTGYFGYSPLAKFAEELLLRSGFKRRTSHKAAVIPWP